MSTSSLPLRSQYLGDCSRYPDLPEAINAGLFLTPRLTPEQLADAIQLPARLPGFDGEVTPELVKRLLAEAADEQDHLPLLQHLLMRLWGGTGADRILTLPGLVSLGGLREALDRHLEEAFAELDEAQQRIAEVLFRGLTERAFAVQGGAERDTRRPAALGEIADLAGAEPAEVAEVAEVFRAPGRSFLMPPAGTELTPESVLDITHEALIRQWRRLRDWTADEAEQAELYQRLESAARRHREKTGALWIDPDLQIALQWRDEHQPGKQWARRYGGELGLAMGFLDASRNARDAQRQAEEQRRQREIRHAREIALASLVALAVTLALAGWAWYERGHAVEPEATAQQKEQQRTRSLFDAGLTHAALLARGEDYAEARKVLRETVELDPAIPEERRHTRNLLAGYVDILGGSADKVYEGAGAALAGGVAVSPDGRWLAAAGERGTLVLLDAESGELVRRLEGHDPKAGQAGVVQSVVFAPDGKSLFSAGEDAEIMRWDVSTGKRLSVWKAPADTMALAIDAAHQLLASGDVRGDIALWSAETGERLRTLEGHADAIAAPNGLDFSPDGKRLASASFDETARIWHVETGETLHTLRWHKDRLEAVAFSPDGNMVATASNDKRIVLWNAETGRPLRLLAGDENIVFGVAFDADGRRLLSASRDNTMRLWDVATGVTLRVYQGHTAGL